MCTNSKCVNTSHSVPTPGSNLPKSARSVPTLDRDLCIDETRRAEETKEIKLGTRREDETYSEEQ